MTKVAMVTDEHFPFQDEKARNVAMQIVSDFDPDIRICGSDGIDFYSLSKFDKNPTRSKAVHLQEEINSWIRGQREWISASPNARPYFLLGNHEDRLRKYLWRHPEIASLDALKLGSVLGFSELGIENEDGTELLLHNRLLIKHGDNVRRNSAYSARAELEREFFSVSVLTGHTHRGGATYATTRKGIVEAHECFCLCRLDPEYVVNPDWQHGIVLATVTKSVLEIESIPFRKVGSKKVAHWRGREYRSR